MHSSSSGRKDVHMDPTSNSGRSGSLPQKQDWRPLRAPSWNNMDTIDKRIDGSGSSGIEMLPGTEYLDHAGSIGKAISKAIATSRRQAQSVTPSSFEEERGKGDEGLSKHEKILRGLRSHTVRKYVSEKAIVRWYEVVSQFNEAAKQMGDYLFWQRNMRNVFCRNANFRVSEKWDGESKSFDLCLPMLYTMWELLEGSGQSSLELKPSRLRAQVLNNGSIILEDPKCCYIGHWKDGSSLDRRICITLSLNLNFKVQWMEVNFTDENPVVNWYALEKMLQTSISNTQMMDKLARLIKLAQMLGSIPHSTPQSGDDGEPSSSSKKAAIKELHSHVRAFSNLSDAGRHQRTRKSFQMADAMTGLTDLLVYQKEKQIISPLETLQNYVTDYQNSKSPYLGEIQNENGILPTLDLNEDCDNSFPISLQKERDQFSKGRKMTRKFGPLVSRSSSASSSSSSSSSSVNSKVLRNHTSGNSMIPGTKKMKF